VMSLNGSSGNRSLALARISRLSFTKFLYARSQFPFYLSRQQMHRPWFYRCRREIWAG
jgi:hypothetical protein